jgi:hypothetical protein
MILIPSFFSMRGNTSLLKYFAAPAGPPRTTSFGSARTMRGAPISAPAADMALVLRSVRRDGVHDVIGFAPGQAGVLAREQALCQLCTFFIII